VPDLFFQEEATDLRLADSPESISDDFLSQVGKAKDISAQIDWVVTHRKIDYLENLLQLRFHKSVAIRRKVAQGVGFLATIGDLESLQKWQLSESDRQTWLILESTIDKVQRGLSGQSLEKSVKILSVSEALVLIKKLIGEGEYVLEGELSEVRPVKQMYYFSIKDKEDSRLDAAAFAGIIIRSGFPMNEGLSVRLTGKFKLSKQSKIYFDVQKLELTGEGALLRNLKLLEEKLTKEGLFSIERKRPLSKFPQSVLLLASPTSAALSDFVKVLGGRRKATKIYLLPIKTQGVGAEYEILENLDEVNNLCKKYQIDTVVITRGGGSQDDLIVFNSEKVVRAIYGIVRPVIVAIGHERDTSLAELVADLRASTPSNAAELVSLSTNEVLQRLNSLEVFAQNYFSDRKIQYNSASGQLFLVISNLIFREIHRLKLICQQASGVVTSLTTYTKSEAKSLWQKCLLEFRNSLNLSQLNLQKTNNLGNQTSFQLQTQKIVNQNFLTRIKFLVYQEQDNYLKKFQLITSQILILDPKNILQKGYALVKQDNRIIEKTSDLKPGKLILTMQDGNQELDNRD